MINFHPLYSSSSGNMFHLETKKTSILIDAGVTYKAINEGLKSIDKDVSKISGVIITHEHIDHIKGIPLLCRKHNIPIFACGKTATYISDMLKERNIPADIYRLEYGQTCKIKDLDITPFETSHDAISPCGFKIQNENTTLGYATDLGYVSNEVFENLMYSDYVVLESNYDNIMLDFGKYPYTTKRRIKSVTGHLSNEDSANAIVRLAKTGNNRFLLGHLSQNNNTEQMAISTINDILIENDINISDISINFASKKMSNEEYNV